MTYVHDPLMFERALRRRAMNDAIQHLLGCEYGRGVSMRDDSEVCSEEAVQIVVLHEGEHSAAFKLCARHRDLVLTQTTPR